MADRVTVLRGAEPSRLSTAAVRDAARARRAHGRPRGRTRRARSARRRPATRSCSRSRDSSARGDRGERDNSTGRVAASFGRARSSGSPASPATGSASWPRRSPACGPGRGHDPCRRDNAPRGDPRDAIAAGVAHVPEDRLGTGLARPQHRGNAVLKTLPGSPVAGPFLTCDASASARRALIERYDVRRPGPNSLRATCRAATSRSSCSAGSSTATSRYWSRPSRRVASTSARSRPCTRLRAAAADGVGGAADQRGPRRDPRARRPDRRHVRGELSAVRREHGNGRGDRVPHGGRRRS